MGELGVEFIEEEDIIEEREQSFEQNKPKGILGLFVRITGFSPKRANVTIVILAIVIFLLAGAIFSARYTDKEVVDNISERVTNFDSTNPSR